MEQAVKTGGELHESAVLSILHITKSTPQKYFRTMLANPGSLFVSFSLGASCSQSRCSTRLSCAPTVKAPSIGGPAAWQV